MEKHLDTICVQGGWKPGNGEPRVLPIYQSTTFKYSSTEEMADLFDLKKEGYFYTRLANPTVDAVAAKINELEGGVGCVLVRFHPGQLFRADGIKRLVQLVQLPQQRLQALGKMLALLPQFISLRAKVGQNLPAAVDDVHFIHLVLGVACNV